YLFFGEVSHSVKTGRNGPLASNVGSLSSKNLALATPIVRPGMVGEGMAIDPAGTGPPPPPKPPGRRCGPLAEAFSTMLPPLGGWLAFAGVVSSRTRLKKAAMPQKSFCFHWRTNGWLWHSAHCI